MLGVTPDKGELLITRKLPQYNEKKPEFILDRF